MRMFLYYSLHSVFNQIRKLFKTWVLIFFAVCFLIGGLLGFAGAKMEEEFTGEEEIVEIEETEELGEDEIAFEEAAAQHGTDWVELGAGFVILGIYTVSVLSAEKNGKRIFLPADVNLLFSSPLKPQTVLMFRIGTQLGMALLGSLYLVFQIPNLTQNMGLSLWSVLALMLTWMAALVSGKLLQILLYVLGSANEAVWKYLRYCVFALLGLLLGAFALFYRLSDYSLIKALTLFFNNPVTRWIPFWGWLKGFLACALKENWAMAVLFLVLLFAGSAALLYWIYHIHADFYEEAMESSEEMAEVLAAASERESGRLTFLHRKKDRSEKLQRTGIGHGSGANIYFFKTMYNRFRFAKLHFLTKTMVTYVFAAVLTALFLRFILEINIFMPIALILSIIVFFRSLGNPMGQDTEMHFFLLIPENTWKKLFYSLIGGTVSCGLDLLPALLIGAVILGINPLLSLCYLPLILSVDYYATCVGTFLELSIPASIGKTIKQVIQIMFIYFGLLPDALIVLVGFIFDWSYGALVLCVLVNVFTASVFFTLAGSCIEPSGGKERLLELSEEERKKAKHTYTVIGFAVFLMFALSYLTQAGILKGLHLMRITVPSSGIFAWLLNFLPIYLCAMPAGLLIMRKLPEERLRVHPLRKRYYLILPCIALFLMYTGNFVAVLIENVLSRSSVHVSESILLNDAVWLRLVFVVILAPMMEELIFRKVLISTMRRYGEETAIIVSALIFGFFHGNLAQAIYASLLGLLLGYVYLRTGRLRNTIALHMFVNFLGGIAAPYILTQMIPSLPPIGLLSDKILKRLLFSWKTLSVILFFVMLAVIYCIGLCAFFIEKKQIHFSGSALTFQKTMKLLANPGLILFFLSAAGMIVYGLI